MERQPCPQRGSVAPARLDAVRGHPRSRQSPGLKTASRAPVESAPPFYGEAVCVQRRRPERPSEGGPVRRCQRTRYARSTVAVPGSAAARDDGAARRRRPPRGRTKSCHKAFWALQNAEFQTNSFRRLSNCPTREDFRTVESIPSDPISQNISMRLVVKSSASSIRPGSCASGSRPSQWTSSS